MRALRFTLILFGLIFAVVAVLAVIGAAQPHHAELIVASPGGLTAGEADEAEAYDPYATPVETPQPTETAAETAPQYALSLPSSFFW